MASPKPPNDEYTDYSCSTSMERLARDVETLLRGWHVDKGNDRHISAKNRSNLLLRQDTLAWNLSLTDRMGRPISLSLELELSLWDGPEEDTQELEAEDATHLPHSLRRNKHRTATALLENLSQLFGIGQHITLTPVQPSTELFWSGDLNCLAQSILLRHEEESTARWSLFQTLSSWLQTALNVAVANCQCGIPVFGIWGHYSLSNPKHRRPKKTEEISLFPTWMQSIVESQLPRLPSMSRPAYQEIQQVQNRQSLAPILQGHVLPTSTGTDMSVCILLGLKESPRLTTWGDLLLQHTSDETVVLWNARHLFVWWKQPMVKASVFQQLFHPDNYHYDSERNPFTAWRRKPKPNLAVLLNHGTTTNEMEAFLQQHEVYQDQCRSLALALLDQASGSSAQEPRWGPVDDPIAALHATVTWNGTQSTNPKDTDSAPVPLLSFPLRIRSQQSMSQDDWKEMEESVERTILDPLQHNQTQFHLQTWWDLETPVASLAASQQCLLAALIRTSTLSDQTVLKHLTDDGVLEQWDVESGNVVAAGLAHRAEVSEPTKLLVDAMDWVTSMEDKMDLRDAEVLVRHILRPDNGSQFPSPPESPLEGHRRRSFVDPSKSNNPFAPLFKSAPLGRLVSILCVHMARLRSPCSMSMVWIAFCHEVRMRWEHRIELPHMNYVEGLDPSPLELKERNRCLTSLGVKAELAAYWHSSSNEDSSVPDAEFPGDHHCLIGQKLQVVNLCIDMVTKVEQQRQKRQMEKRRKTEGLENGKQGSRVKITRTSITEQGNGHTSTTKQNGKKISSPETGERYEDSMNNDNSERYEESMYNDNSEGYEDALSEEEDNASFVPILPDDSAAAVAAAAKRTMDLAKQQPARKGARCPVPGSSLVTNGDQMYAPYLQRPYPLTDDVIAERHSMLSRHYDPAKSKAQVSHHSIYKRLEISYRLQKPKLLSDMCAFKAANPGSIFQDFINWYGNPGNPLDDYSDNRNRRGSNTMGDLFLGRASAESVAVKLDKASEAIQMLNETREFWSRTWEEATAIPASEQKLLFDVTSTVEMALDFMENMHPAILINQIMAVNLSVAYFTLIGAAKEVGVLKVGGPIQRAYQRLRDKTEQALELLAADATNSTSSSLHTHRYEGSSNFVSVTSISACDAACSALSEAEVLTARATSLLNKFPEQYELVESIIRCSAGEEIRLSNPTAQGQVLAAIQVQQEQRISRARSSSKKKAQLQPALREYVLRNLDDSHPCQLSIRIADESMSVKADNNTNSRSLAEKGGVIIALTKNHVQ